MSPVPTSEIRKETADTSRSRLILEVRNVAKRYHLWKSPRARLIYGLWSQVPRWAPPALQRLAQKEKTRLGQDFYALHNVSFQLRQGESLAILGRNGSGKSTLLQIICGILQPSTGSVVRGCQRVAALLELGSGFNPEFTGRENVYLNGAVLGLRKDEIDARFERILDFAEIGRFIDQPVKTYSSGMMVRLAFAVQVQVDPELLIVDEALGVGDVFFQQKCFAHMRHLKERGCSFLLVSHDAISLQQLCDRGIVIVDGHKHFEGSSSDAIREYYLTENTHHARGASQLGYRREKQKGPREFDKIDEPERWFRSEDPPQASDSLAKLVRWSCADDSGKTVDQFFENENIRLFVEFECKVLVHEVSAGFSIRDKAGQVIHAKHLYQMRSETKISMDQPFSLLCEFSLSCRLRPGEYTVEFGLIDIPPTSDITQHHTPDAQPYSILYWGPPVARFAVVPREIDPLRRRGHFGIVDSEGEARFQIRTSENENLPSSS